MSSMIMFELACLGTYY